jgi:hypothetical protein
VKATTPVADMATVFNPDIGDADITNIWVK